VCVCCYSEKWILDFCRASISACTKILHIEDRIQRQYVHERRVYIVQKKNHHNQRFFNPQGMIRGRSNCQYTNKVIITRPCFNLLLVTHKTTNMADNGRFVWTEAEVVAFLTLIKEKQITAILDSKQQRNASI